MAVKRIPSVLRRPERRSIGSAGDYGIGMASAGGPVLSGVFVTPQTALSFTAVYAAINVISTDVSVLPFNSYELLANGGKKLIKDDVDELINISPDGELNAQRYWLMQMGHALTWGNGYSEIIRKGNGAPQAAKWLDPRHTRPRRLDNGSLVYETREDRQGLRYILPENVLHFAGLGFDGLQGYSPLTLARQAVGLGIAAEQFGAALFGNGAIPKGLLKTPKRLSDTAWNNLRGRWNEVHQGSQNAHKIGLLEEGMDWINTQIPPEDAQFLATRQFQVLEIARIYRVPPHKLGDFSQSHLTNIEASNLDYLTRTLVGWLIGIEAECNLKLYTRADRMERECLHNLWSLMKGDMQSRAEFYTKLSNLGVLTPNMICQFENLNPIGPMGDKRLVPLNMTTLEQAGEPPEPAEPAEPAAEAASENGAKILPVAKAESQVA